MGVPAAVDNRNYVGVQGVSVLDLVPTAMVRARAKAKRRETSASGMAGMLCDLVSLVFIFGMGSCDIAFGRREAFLMDCLNAWPDSGILIFFYPFTGFSEYLGISAMSGIVNRPVIPGDELTYTCLHASGASRKWSHLSYTNLLSHLVSLILSI